MITAFLMISADLSRINELAAELAALDSVSEVYSTTGEDDLIVVIRTRSLDALAEVVTREIARLEGIRSTRTDVALRVYSRHDLEAIWDIGAAP